jgi:hypothetical protein
MPRAGVPTAPTTGEHRYSVVRSQSAERAVSAAKDRNG